MVLLLSSVMNSRRHSALFTHDEATAGGRSVTPIVTMACPWNNSSELEAVRSAVGVSRLPYSRSPLNGRITTESGTLGRPSAALSRVTRCSRGIRHTANHGAVRVLSGFPRSGDIPGPRRRTIMATGGSGHR